MKLAVQHRNRQQKDFFPLRETYPLRIIIIRHFFPVIFFLRMFSHLFYIRFNIVLFKSINKWILQNGNSICYGDLTFWKIDFFLKIHSYKYVLFPLYLTGWDLWEPFITVFILPHIPSVFLKFYTLWNISLDCLLQI